MSKLYIRPDGTIEGLYTDVVPLQEIGSLNVIRATNVEFDPERQKWIVTLPDGEEIFTNSSRETALIWERSYCDSLLNDGLRVPQPPKEGVVT